MKIVCCWMFAIGKYGFPPSLPDMLKAIPEMASLGFEYVELEGVGFENLRAVIDNREHSAMLCRRAASSSRTSPSSCPRSSAKIPLLRAGPRGVYGGRPHRRLPGIAQRLGR